MTARDAPASELAVHCLGAEETLETDVRPERTVAWADSLDPIELTSANTGAVARVRLYDATGEVDPAATEAFERVASREPEPHRLSHRVEQLIFKAAYHFGVARVFVVSGWRYHAGRHGLGDAVDFRLPGVRPRDLAAYLRGLPRVGVGLYTHPDTQFVHVDVRDTSFHWVDASPPGVHWKERALADKQAARRDAEYDPEMDLP